MEFILTRISRELDLRAAGLLSLTSSFSAVERVGLDVVGETEEGVVKFCVVVSGKSEIVVTPPEVSEK